MGARIGLCMLKFSPSWRRETGRCVAGCQKRGQPVEFVRQIASDPAPAEESRMKLAWLALGAAAMAPPLDAAPLPTRVTGRALAALCDADRNACIGYVVGAVDAFVATQITRGGPVTFCLPAGVTNQQLAEAALRAIR